MGPVTIWYVTKRWTVSWNGSPSVSPATLASFRPIPIYSSKRWSGVCPALQRHRGATTRIEGHRTAFILLLVPNPVPKAVRREIDPEFHLCDTDSYFSVTLRRTLARHRLLGPGVSSAVAPKVGPIQSSLLHSGRIEGTRASLGRDDVKEYAFVVVLQVVQIVGEIGEIVADAGLHVLAEAMINRSQHAAAGLMEIR
jgi:hypothetical protein